MFRETVKRKEASLYTGDSAQLLPKVNTKNIERNMKWLKESEDEWDKDTLRLILEFDRWNNFRILPRMLQQPSAFKRRSNKRTRYTSNTYLIGYPIGCTLNSEKGLDIR